MRHVKKTDVWEKITENKVQQEAIREWSFVTKIIVFQVVHNCKNKIPTKYNFRMKKKICLTYNRQSLSTEKQKSVDTSFVQMTKVHVPHVPKNSKYFHGLIFS